MNSESSFPLDKSTAAMLELHKKDKRSAVERYLDPEWQPYSGEWPQTVQVFQEWYTKNAGILHLIEPLKKVITSDDDVQILVGTLGESLERAFNDMHDLLLWAMDAWERDPLILEVGSEQEEETGAPSNTN